MAISPTSIPRVDVRVSPAVARLMARRDVRLALGVTLLVGASFCVVGLLAARSTWTRTPATQSALLLLPVPWMCACVAAFVASLPRPTRLRATVPTAPETTSWVILVLGLTALGPPTIVALLGAPDDRTILDTFALLAFCGALPAIPITIRHIRNVVDGRARLSRVKVFLLTAGVQSVSMLSWASYQVIFSAGDCEPTHWSDVLPGALVLLLGSTTAQCLYNVVIEWLSDTLIASECAAWTASLAPAATPREQTVPKRG